jgi:Spy/CpxP family protein refolding chaperone
MKRNYQWIALLTLIATALIGGALGSTITLWVVNSRTLAAPTPPASPAEMPTRMMHHRNLERVVARLQEDLALTLEQRQAIHKDMQGLAGEFQQLHESTNQSMRTLVDRGRQIILKHLTPEQAQKYEMESRQRVPRRWQERLERPLRPSQNWRERRRDSEHDESDVQPSDPRDQGQ